MIKHEFDDLLHNVIRLALTFTQLRWHYPVRQSVSNPPTLMSSLYFHINIPVKVLSETTCAHILNVMFLAAPTERAK